MTSNEFFTSEVAKFISENAHKFYDARLITSDNHRYPINKVVLAVRSDFFKCLFKWEGIACSARDVHENGQLEEFDLPTVSHQALEPILHWIYNNEFKVHNLETILMVLKSAEFLGLEDMSDVCQQWIQDNMDAHNVLGILSYAQANFLKYLRNKAWDLLMGNFPEVAKGDEWLNQDAAQVAKIIDNDELLCEEEEVWKAVIKWAEHHKKMDEDIMKEVRFGLLSERFFNIEIRNHPLIKNNPIIMKADNYFTTLSNLPGPSNDLLEFVSFAVPRSPSNFMLTFGGWSQGSPISTISVHDPRADMWKNLGVDLPFPWVYMSSVTHNNNIYLAGGATHNPNVAESTEIIRNLWKFDPQDLSLRKLSHMREKRNYLCMVVLNDEIYALGGHNGSTEAPLSSRVNSGEVYKISRNQWYPINPMNEIRSDFGAAVLGGKIFAVGGLDGVRPSNTVEVFTPATGSWKLLTPMLSPRSGVKCVSFREKLVVVGGFDGTNRLSSCEFFDPKKSSWSYLPRMTAPRSNHALSVVEGKIVVAGGFNGSSTTDIVEVFDWDLWKWRTATSLPISLSAMTSAVVVTTELDIDARERFRFKEREKILEARKIKTQKETRNNITVSEIGGGEEDDYSVTGEDDSNIEEYDSSSSEEESIDMEENDSDTTWDVSEDEDEGFYFINGDSSSDIEENDT